MPQKELQIFSKGVFDLTFVSLKKRTVSLNIAAVVLVAFIIANLVFIWINSAKVDTSSNKDSKKLAETIVKRATKDYESLTKAQQQKSNTQNKRLKFFIANFPSYKIFNMIR